MPTVCMHCALEAFVAGKSPATATFDESPAEHLARVHPGGVDPAARRALEIKAAAMLPTPTEAPE